MDETKVNPKNNTKESASDETRISARDETKIGPTEDLEILLKGETKVSPTEEIEEDDAKLLKEITGSQATVFGDDYDEDDQETIVAEETLKTQEQVFILL